MRGPSNASLANNYTDWLNLNLRKFNQNILNSFILDTLIFWNQISRYGKKGKEGAF